jgi:hypothetical protein
LKIENSAVDEVTFTLSNTSNPVSGAGQFISTLLLNIDPYMNVSTSSSSASFSSASSSLNGHTRVGKTFDYKVEFETANNGNRVTPGVTVVFKATASGLTENHFNALSTGSDPVPAMIHMQGIPPTGDSSWAAPVPEPASMTALGLGLIALLRRRKK